MSYSKSKFFTNYGYIGVQNLPDNESCNGKYIMNRHEDDYFIQHFSKEVEKNGLYIKSVGFAGIFIWEIVNIEPLENDRKTYTIINHSFIGGNPL